MKALLVDGYNLIYAHEELSRLVESDMDAAREGLVRELQPLAAPGRYGVLMVVFDAAGSPNPEPVFEERGGITVVFTRRTQSADSFIERAARSMTSRAEVSEVAVATSDRVLSSLAAGFGARAIDGRSLLERAREAAEETREEMRSSAARRVPLEERVGERIRRLLDEMRYG
ncbi:MAG: NYN domain-containing protein [Actinobacteria bacterium]|nr:NYN domain-containing protein [Actinomycetota bacterium]MDI6830264.1 NYN domain-containing protein [Actinomycetota bacterium]